MGALQTFDSKFCHRTGIARSEGGGQCQRNKLRLAGLFLVNPSNQKVRIKFIEKKNNLSDNYFSRPRSSPSTLPPPQGRIQAPPLGTTLLLAPAPPFIPVLSENDPFIHDFFHFFSSTPIRPDKSIFVQIDNGRVELSSKFPC